VFISSSAALNARGEKGFYSAAQYARRALADALRNEVNKDGIRVLNVFLGRTATPLMQNLYAKEGRPYKADLLLQPGDVASVIVNALALPWTAELTELSLRPMKKSY
jgi:NADP-dependent 3-hydroxy acid dehydrogenase YdfG